MPSRDFDYAVSKHLRMLQAKRSKSTALEDAKHTKDVLTSSAERLTCSQSQAAKGTLSLVSKDISRFSAKPKTAYKSKSEQRPLARLSEKRVYNESNKKPVYLPYAQCTCAIEKHSDGQDKLYRAERSGKALYVLDHDGTQAISVAHLRHCVRFVVSKPVEYDPATIVSDFLRATGSHPRKPALNYYWNKTMAREMQAICTLKEAE